MFRSLLPPLALCAMLGAQHHVCTITPAGAGCATLTVTMTPRGNSGNHALTLHATGLHPRSPGAMVWGMEPLNLPIYPGSSCPLLTNFVWGHTFQTDADGEYSWSRTWPWHFNGFFYMQMGSVTPHRNNILDARTTNCELVRCLLP